MAGSERFWDTKAEGDRAKEASSINKSLSTLGLVINQLVKGNSFVSYWDSVLTKVLKNSLGGNAKTLVIANISPSDKFILDTVSTLQFA